MVCSLVQSLSFLDSSDGLGQNGCQSLIFYNMLFSGSLTLREPLLSRGLYFRGAVTFEEPLLSGVVTQCGGSLLGGANNSL